MHCRCSQAFRVLFTVAGSCRAGRERSGPPACVWSSQNDASTLSRGPTRPGLLSLACGSTVFLIVVISLFGVTQLFVSEQELPADVDEYGVDVGY